MPDPTPENGEVTDPSFFDFNEGTQTITGYDAEGSKEVVIPSEINGADVEVIGQEAFRSNELTSVDIGNSVEEIKEKGFQNNDLESVVIGGSVGEIKYAAFGANPLTSVEIGDG